MKKLRLAILAVATIGMAALAVPSTPVLAQGQKITVGVTFPQDDNPF